MKLNEIKRPVGRKARKNKRLGRGDASGQGGTAGRGHKGQKARAGGYHKVGFEGGQMPLSRRLPKRGFTNIHRKEYAIVNLDQLTKAFPNGGEITIDSLLEKRVVRKRKNGLKVLGRGELKGTFTVRANNVSKSARSKIEAQGGSIELLNS
jgi:large subunit ribosomal protein L15